MEIEFRAKAIKDYKVHNIKKGNWVYGYVQFKVDVLCNPCTYINDTKFGDLSIEVDPKTVCQYTNCKDKHGNKIYYHDFVRKRVRNNPKGVVCIVVFRKGGFYATEQTCDDDSYTLKDSQIEVLGNMFDNPNLFCLKLYNARLENNFNDYWVNAPYDD